VVVSLVVVLHVTRFAFQARDTDASSADVAGKSDRTIEVALEVGGL
jgi:hypothetical protein